MEALIKRLRGLFNTTGDDDHVNEKESGLDALKAFIKTNVVPERLAGPIFSIVRKATASSQLTLVVKGFKTFLYLVPRLYKQGMESLVFLQTHKTLSIFRQRRQDDNAEIRSLAEQSIAVFETDESTNHGAGWTPAEAFTPPPPDVDEALPLVSIENAQTLTNHARDIQNELEIDDVASTASWDRRVKPKLIMIRGIMKGNGPQDFKTEYNALITTTLPGILHTCRDNRTTVSILGCRVIRELAFTTPQECGKHTDRIFNEIEYLCHSTRNIVAEQGRITNNVLLAYVPFQAKYFNLISHALTGVKNLNTRESAAIWMVTLLSRGQEQSNTMTPYMNVITTTLKKGLNDRELPVKAKMTFAFWVFARLFEREAQKLFLESPERLQVFLMKDNMSFTLSEDWLSRRSLTAPKASVINRNESRPHPYSSTTASTSTSRPATAMSIPRPTSALSTTSSPRPSQALPVRPAPPNRPHTAIGSTTGSIQSAPRRAPQPPATEEAAPPEPATPARPTKKRLPSYYTTYKKQTWRPARIRDAKPEEYQLKREKMAIHKARAELARRNNDNGRVRGLSDVSSASTGSA